MSSLGSWLGTWPSLPKNFIQSKDLHSAYTWFTLRTSVIVLSMNLIILASNLKYATVFPVPPQNLIITHDTQMTWPLATFPKASSSVLHLTHYSPAALTFPPHSNSSSHSNSSYPPTRCFCSIKLINTRKYLIFLYLFSKQFAQIQVP